MHKKKRYSKNEFRYNIHTKHINYVFEEDGNYYHGLGLTHQKNTFGKKNMPLKFNPNFKDKRKAYIRTGYITDNKKSYSKHKSNNFRFSSIDFYNVKSKVKHYKSARRYKKR